MEKISYTKCNKSTKNFLAYVRNIRLLDLISIIAATYFIKILIVWKELQHLQVFEMVTQQRIAYLTAAAVGMEEEPPLPSWAQGLTRTGGHWGHPDWYEHHLNIRSGN